MHGALSTCSRLQVLNISLTGFQVLQERGASVLQRAMDNDVPLDPVYYDGKSWKAPAFDTQAKQLPW